MGDNSKYRQPVDYAFPTDYRDKSGKILSALGLTKEEWMVGMALSGFCANPNLDFKTLPEKTLARTVSIAANAAMEYLQTKGVK